MASGFFNIVEPGLAYAQRLSYRANPAELPVDPQNALCPIAGEWLTISSGNLLTRPGLAASGKSVLLSAVALAFPLLMDRGRSDTQSSAVAGIGTLDGPGAKLTVLSHIGAHCTSSGFATLANSGAAAVTYAPGDNLILCLYRDQDDPARLRCGLTKVGLTVATGLVAGNIEETLETFVVAKVLRAPYSISGVGVTAGRGFPPNAVGTTPATYRQVMDIIIK